MLLIKTRTKVAAVAVASAMLMAAGATSASAAPAVFSSTDSGVRVLYPYSFSIQRGAGTGAYDAITCQSLGNGAINQVTNSGSPLQGHVSQNGVIIGQQCKNAFNNPVGVTISAGPTFNATSAAGAFTLSSSAGFSINVTAGGPSVWSGTGASSPLTLPWTNGTHAIIDPSHATFSNTVVATSATLPVKFTGQMVIADNTPSLSLVTLS